jgi:hypothetical protein
MPVTQAVEIRHFALLKVFSEQPSRMDLCIVQIVSLLDLSEFAITVIPMPDRNTKSSQNEVRRISRNLRSPGFVHVAEIHRVCSVGECAQKKRLGFWGGSPQDETLGDSSQTHWNYRLSVSIMQAKRRPKIGFGSIFPENRWLGIPR